MRIKFFIVILAAVASCASIPQPSKNLPQTPALETQNPTASVGELERREVTHLYVCKDAQFKGCQNLESQRGSCHTLYNGFNNAITSVGPDHGTVCSLYDDNDCRKWLLDVQFPGIADLSLNVKKPFNDKIGSYVCW